MRVTVKDYSTPLKGVLLTGIHPCGKYAFRVLVSDGKGGYNELKPRETILDISHFSQGKENIIGNNSVSHSQLTGEITLLPNFSSQYPTVRSISNKYPNGEVSPYYAENIGIFGCYFIGDCEYSQRRNQTFYQDGFSLHAKQTWSMDTVTLSTHFLPGSSGGERTEDLISKAYFPTFSDADIIYSAPPRGGICYTKKKVEFKVFNPAGQVVQATSDTVRFKFFDSITSSVSIADLKEMLKIPSAGGATIPDDLLMKFSKKIGSLKVNNLANMAQLRKLNEFLPPILNKKAKVFKTAADFLLWWKYSVKTTELDISTMMEYFLRRSDPIVPVGHKGYCHRTTVSNRVDDYTIDRFTVYTGSYQQSIFQKFGLQLNLGNTWDMIPFSFVVDWFLKIGDALESIDAADEWAQVPVCCFVASRKRISPYKLPDKLCATGMHLTYSFYVRDVSRHLPMVVVSPSLNLPSGNILTALSLLIANKR